MAMLVLLAGTARAGIVAAHVVAVDDGALGLRGRGELLCTQGHGFRVFVRVQAGRGFGVHQTGATGGALGTVLDLFGHLFGLGGRTGICTFSQHAADFGADDLQQVLEQLEGFALVLLLGVFLRIAAEVDALTQVIQRPTGARASAGRWTAA